MERQKLTGPLNISLEDEAATPATNVPALALLAAICSIGSGAAVAWAPVKPSSTAMGGDIFLKDVKILGVLFGSHM